MRQIALAVAWRQAAAHWTLWHWKAAEQPLLPTAPLFALPRAPARRPSEASMTS